MRKIKNLRLYGYKIVNHHPCFFGWVTNRPDVHQAIFRHGFPFTMPEIDEDIQWFQHYSSCKAAAIEELSKVIYLCRRGISEAKATNKSEISVVE